MTIFVRSIKDHIPYGVTAYCLDCKRGEDLDLVALATTYGEDTDFRLIMPRLRCKVCGGKAEVRLGHPEPVHLKRR